MTSEPPERPGHPVKGRLSVRNLQRRIPIDSGPLRAFLEIVGPAAGAPSGSATVALVTDGRMRTLNRDFRGLDKPTDVLSFRTSRKGASRGYLGDIVISVETAERQARRLRSTLPRELEVLALHGFLHLLGYDHETDDGEMRRLEYRLRRKLRVTRSRRERSEPGREEAAAPKARGRGNFAVGVASKGPGNISFLRSSPNADDSAVLPERGARGARTSRVLKNSSAPCASGASPARLRADERPGRGGGAPRHSNEGRAR